MASRVRQLLESSPRRGDGRADIDLGRWLCELRDAPRFRDRCAALDARITELRSFTPSDEMATITMLVEHLCPRLVIEIGTFFAGTSRVIAEALVTAGQDGRLLTIDPYGGHRVPEIIEGWPPELGSRVEFRALTSMALFDEWETTTTASGAGGPLGLAFVDGNHNFEYALFDVMSSAAHVMPGGAIVVDNLEQQGPRQACVEFLGWNPAWRLVADHTLVAAGEAARAQLTGVNWGVLVAPAGIQVARMTRKFSGRADRNAGVGGVRVNAQRATGPGRLAVRLVCIAFPYDFHLHGTGAVQVSRSGEIAIDLGQNPFVEFAEPVELDLPGPDFNVNYELELTFSQQDDPHGFILLDPDEPYTLSPTEASGPE